MIEKLNELPKYWVVQCDASHPDWMKVIDYLNKISNIEFIGQSNDLYYGYDGNNGAKCGDYNYLILAFKNNPVVLTIDEFVKLTSKEIVEIDFTIRGTKLPTIPKGVEYLSRRGQKYIFIDTKDYLVSFGSKLINEEIYIKAEHYYYPGDHFFLIKLSDIEKLAREQSLTLQKEERMIKITREQLHAIYKVACSEWQKKIRKIVEGFHFSNDITLTQAQVDEMFKAATKDQLPTLEEIFGKPLKELDFRVDINEKVDDLKIFGGLETGHTEAFIVLPADNPKDKNRFYLNPKYNWELKDDELIVTRK